VVAHSEFALLLSYIAVSGPKDACCRLEGLLDTIAGRGRDLQSTLDENRQIEENLRKQIAAELAKEPEQPIISEPPDYAALASENNDSEISQPLTPPGAGGHAYGSNAKTPEHALRARDNALILPGAIGTPRSDENRSAGNHESSPSCPRSPNSIDNADIERSGIPGYRRAVSEDDLDHLAFGCGAALGTSLWGDTWSARENGNLIRSSETAANDLTNSAARLRRQAVADTLMMHATPTLTSSFDNIDFRTGLSGHRGLNHASKPSPGHSPTTRGRPVRFMMSAHTGIGRVRQVPRKNSPTNAPTSSAAAASPSFAPRFSPFPGSDTS